MFSLHTSVLFNIFAMLVFSLSFIFSFLEFVNDCVFVFFIFLSKKLVYV